MKKILKPVLIGFITWTGYNFLNAGVLALQQKLLYWLAWVSVATQNYIAALLCLPLWFFCKRFPFTKSRIMRFFAVHFLISLFFSALWLTLTYLGYLLTVGDSLVKFMISERYYLWQLLNGLTMYGLLTGIFYTINFYKKFKEKELRETELGLLTKKMELQNLKSQINPHFLFNALNSVNALMAKDPEKARTMNSKLAQLLRFSLEGYDSKFVTLKQELDFIRNYLDIEKVRFGDKLEIYEEIEESTLNAKVPGMILQPIVENAIKHGISKKTNGGRLNIHIFKNDGLLNFEVSNSGKTGNEKEISKLLDKGVGLKNTNERLKRIYGDEFGLELNNQNPGVFSVKIKIPHTLKS